MTNRPKDSQMRAAGRQRFATTHWSLVLAAGRSDPAAAAAALGELCETYWFPIYAWVRRQGCQVAEAQDLVQGFFARLLEKGDLADVDPARGRFRSFLLAAMKHYLHNERDKARALKRGGGRQRLALDFDAAESRYRLEPVDRHAPDVLFERQWALVLLEQVRSALRDEAAAAGKAEQFDALEPYLTAEPAADPYVETASRLDMTTGAVKLAVHRLRRRFRDRLRAEIARTIDAPAEVDDEIRDLFAALRR